MKKKAEKFANNNNKKLGKEGWKRYRGGGRVCEKNSRISGLSVSRRLEIME